MTKRLMALCVAAFLLVSGAASPAFAEANAPLSVDETQQVAHEALLRELSAPSPHEPLPEGAVDLGQVSADFTETFAVGERGTCSVAGRVFYNKATLFGVGTYFNLYVKAGFGCSAGVIACSTSFAVAAGIPFFGTDVGTGFPFFDQTYSCSTTTTASQTGPIPNLAVVYNTALAFDGTAVFPPQVIDIR